MYAVKLPVFIYFLQQNEFLDHMSPTASPLAPRLTCAVAESDAAPEQRSSHFHLGQVRSSPVADGTTS
ncbi:unnamed protein product [Toxocara canis]|uniref:Uncharacterized protein n=1 Tax=Toxocara canis TaxID=6265 RepID=A0A183U709_TOXCA|nr:unnamed protein product [Toxocara canis]